MYVFEIKMPVRIVDMRIPLKKTVMKRLFSFFLVVLSFLLAGSMSSAEECPEIVIAPDEPIAGVSDLFWGTNFLFWIEDDASLSDGKIEAAMKDLPIRLLRYPGGTVADNFHWKTNLLDNHFMFPYEEGPDESDFDEFMSFCSKVGAEPMLVVNTQSWALKDDIKGGAEEAAEWVRYCKEKGYDVKYWEIGNETYWHPVMTAREYGELVNVYAAAMRAEDPDIILSVNGGWDIAMTGNKERTDSSEWKSLKDSYGRISSVSDYKSLKEHADSIVVRPWTTGEDKWWHDLISVCGKNIDMVSVHWYYHDNVIKHIDKKMTELKHYLKSMVPEKDYLVCLSEFNCNTKDYDQRVAGLAESLGRFLNAGTDLACFWPFRLGGNPSVESNRNMLSLDEKNRQYPYVIFQLFQQELQGNMVRCTGPENPYAFASVNGSEMTVVLSGRCLDGNEAVKVSCKDGGYMKVRDAWEFVPDPKAEGGMSRAAASIEKSGRGFIVQMRPESFVLVSVSLK